MSDTELHIWLWAAWTRLRLTSRAVSRAARIALRTWLRAVWGLARVHGFRVKRYASRFAKKHLRRMGRSRVRRLVLLACLAWLAHVTLSHPAAAETLTAVAGMTGMACARLSVRKVPEQQRRKLTVNTYP